MCCEEGEVCSLQKFSILIICLYLIIKKKQHNKTWLISMAYHRQKYLVHWQITYLGEVIHIATNLNVPGKKKVVFCHLFQEAKRTECAFWMNSHLLCPGFIINKKQLVSLLCFFFWPLFDNSSECTVESRFLASDLGKFKISLSQFSF